MPLNQGCSRKAFQENIRKMIEEENQSRSQVVAIAFDTLRKSCKARGKPMPVKGEEDAWGTYGDNEIKEDSFEEDSDTE